jgi:hypothetical protein
MEGAPKAAAPTEVDSSKQDLPYAGESIQQYIAALGATDVRHRRRAAAALGRLGPAAGEAVEHLLKALDDPDEAVRWWATSSLGDLGPAGSSAVPALVDLLKDETIRFAAIEALAKLGPREVPSLVNALRDPNPLVRLGAVEALGQIGPDAREAYPAIHPLLNDADRRVRESASKALENISQSSSVASTMGRPWKQLLQLVYGQPVNSIAFNHDGRGLAATGEADAVAMWRVSDGKMVRRIEQAATHGVAFSPDGKVVACVGPQGMTIWSVASEVKLKTFADESGSRTRAALARSSERAGVAFSPGGELIAGLGQIWHVKEARLLYNLDVSPFGLGVAFSRDGKFVATGSSTWLGVWTVADGKLFRAFEEYENRQNMYIGSWSVAFSPQGDSLAAVGRHGTITVRRIADGKLRGKLYGGQALCVAFSPDGRILAGGTKQGEVRLWLASGGERPFRTLSGHEGEVRCVSFSPNGSFLASGGEDGTIRVWEVPTQE